MPRRRRQPTGRSAASGMENDASWDTSGLHANLYADPVGPVHARILAFTGVSAYGTTVLPPRAEGRHLGFSGRRRRLAIVEQHPPFAVRRAVPDRVEAAEPVTRIGARAVIFEQRRTARHRGIRRAGNRGARGVPAQQHALAVDDAVPRLGNGRTPAQWLRTLGGK